MLLEYLRAIRAHLAGQAGARDAVHVATHELWNCFDRPIAALVGFCANADVDLTRSLDAPGRITLCSTDDFIVCCCRLAEQGAYAAWPSVAMALRHTMQLMVSTHAAMDAAYPDAPSDRSGYELGGGAVSVTVTVLVTCWAATSGSG